MPSSTTGSFKSPSFKSFRSSKSSSKRARKKELESAVEDTNNNEPVEPAENTTVAQLKKKHPLVSSRSLLRIGLLKNRNSQFPAPVIGGQELPSNNNNSAPASISPLSLNKDEKAVLKARRKMTQRASSLSDFFHHSSVGTPIRPLPASSMAAAAMSANRRTSKPFSTAVPFLPLTCEPSSSQSSHNSANSSSFCCSALRKSRSRGNANSTAHAIASSNATVLGLPNIANATDAMTPEYGAAKNRAGGPGAESSILACSSGQQEMEYSSNVEKHLLSGLQPNARPTECECILLFFYELVWLNGNEE